MHKVLRRVSTIIAVYWHMTPCILVRRDARIDLYVFTSEETIIFKGVQVKLLRKDRKYCARFMGEKGRVLQTNKLTEVIHRRSRIKIETYLKISQPTTHSIAPTLMPSW